MFEPGKSYKLKVEFPSGNVGLGKATVVGREGSKLLVDLRVPGEGRTKPAVGTGTRITFVGNSGGTAAFNGLWRCTVTGMKIVGGKTAIECTNPRFESVEQRRQSRRLPVECPVKVLSQNGVEPQYKLWTKNISNSGVGLETAERDASEFKRGEPVSIIIQSDMGDIPVECRVIRTDYNWLANRNAIGLEFTELSPEAAATLNQLLAVLRQSAPPEEEEQTPGKLSGRMRATSQNLKLIKQPPTDSNGQTE